MSMVGRQPRYLNRMPVQQPQRGGMPAAAAARPIAPPVIPQQQNTQASSQQGIPDVSSIDPSVGGMAAGGDPADQNQYGSWGAGIGDGVSGGNYGQPAAVAGGSQNVISPTPPSTNTAVSASAAPAGVNPVGGYGGGNYGGALAADTGGGIPDPGDAIPADPNDPGTMQDTNQGGGYQLQQGDPNATMDKIMQALSTARQKNGLTDQMFAGNIPAAPANNNSQPLDPSAVRYPTPMVPGNAGFGTKGQKTSDNSSPQDDSGASDQTADNEPDSDSDSDVQGAATGGAIKALDDGGDPGDDTDQGGNDPDAPGNQAPTGQPTGVDQQATSSDPINNAYQGAANVVGGAAKAIGAIPGEIGDAANNAVSAVGNTATAIPEGSEDSNQTATIMKYLQGADAAPQQQVTGAERQIDPQGKMNPTQRTMAVIASAPDADTGAAYLQAYRAQYNTYRGGAAAALNGTTQGPANPKVAAQNATLAHMNIPDGNNVAFTPTQGGMVAHVRNLTTNKTDQVPMTNEQFNQLMRGPEGTFDNFMEQPATKVIGSVAQGQGKPLTPPAQGGAQAAQPGAQPPAGQTVKMGGTFGSGNVYKTLPGGGMQPQDMQSAGTNTPTFNATYQQEDPDAALKQFPAEDVAAAKARFPDWSASGPQLQAQRVDWLEKQKQQGTENDIANTKLENVKYGIDARRTTAEGNQASRGSIADNKNKTTLAAAGITAQGRERDTAIASAAKTYNAIIANGGKPTDAAAALAPAAKAIGMALPDLVLRARAAPVVNQDTEQNAAPSQSAPRQLKDGRWVTQGANGKWQQVGAPGQ